MQDDKGQWYGLKKFTLDTVAKTISGNINHFSTWVSFDYLYIGFVLSFNRKSFTLSKRRPVHFWNRSPITRRLERTKQETDSNPVNEYRILF